MSVRSVVSGLPKVWQCFETVGKREPQATEAFWMNSDLTGSGGGEGKRGNHVQQTKGHTSRGSLAIQHFFPTYNMLPLCRHQAGIERMYS